MLPRLALLTCVALGSLAAPSVVTLQRREPSEASQHVDINLSGQIYPEVGGSQGLVIDCEECWIRGDFTFGFGHNDPPSSNINTPLVSPKNVDWDDVWIGVAVNKFEAHFAFSVTYDGTVAPGADLIMRVKDKPFDIPLRGALGGLINVRFDPQVHATLNASRALVFKHGFKVTVPPGSAVIIPLLHLDQSIAPGIGDTEATMLDFQSSVDDLNFDYEFSIRPSIGLSFNEFGADYSILSYIDVPKVKVGIQQVQNVGPSCGAAGGEKTFEKMTQISPSLGYEVGITVNNDEVLPKDLSPKLVATPATCLLFDSGKKALVNPNGVARTSASAATLMAALAACFVLLM